MTIKITSNLTYPQRRALEEVLNRMEIMRNAVRDEGDDVYLADDTDALVSDVEQLYLEFSNDKKRYF